DRGDRNGRADRVEQRTARQPYFALAIEVGCHRRERNRQFLDFDVADQFTQHADDALALDQARAGQGPVHQLQHVHLLQRAYPVAVDIELAGRVDAADQRAHGTARHRDDAVARRLDRFDRADVRQTARTAGAERQRERRLDLPGFDEGLAIVHGFAWS